MIEVIRIHAVGLIVPFFVTVLVSNSNRATIQPATKDGTVVPMAVVLDRDANRVGFLPTKSKEQLVPQPISSRRA